ncbi:thiol protease/hemagglutinin PrtT [Adhaeribacter rhizoryzae]|uniref:T9SS type A sorting domain-containing protein n=1 Tax=Adhaeribacter rhizoryzae TaxID=2607907 RepID=A0A5M6DA33_9BACT|nr:thiol protease/hemagglutinin PrtT [Adhaeribacter rhizoryzae]KAA5543396.1 T9SS type A sorting domain-containing protein [Adhaeribacter rhizoryzae]
MKKIYLMLLACLIFWQSSLAKEVPEADAQRVASNFLTKVMPLRANGRSTLTLTLVHRELAKAAATNAPKKPQPFYYVFSAKETGGTVFVAADDRVTPILGYTLKGGYDPAKMPPSLIKWLENYKNEIRFAEKQATANPTAQSAWQDLKTGDKTSSSSDLTTAEEVDPLLTTTWNQSPYYNELCPYDNAARQKAVTGCVATAMAQIMRYWKYPAKGSGFHSYNHEKYGTLSANFSNTTYDWNNMPNRLTGPNAAVATLMQNIGVSVDMNYDVAANGGSGAYVISSASPVQHCSEYALKTYFGYTEVKGVERNDYTLSAWIELLKKELSEGRPILYAGFGSGGGHAFVCDGYDQNNMFHMNWGWDGAYDGFFAISALNPSGVGTGGGTGGFNSNQQAVINIKAPTNTPQEQTSKLELYENVTINASTVNFGGAFTVHTDIINRGTGTFQGDYAAAIFDEAGTFIEFVQTFTGNELQANYHYTEGIDFKTDGMASLLPGNYNIYIYARTTGGQWEQVKGGTFTAGVTLKVVNNNTIDLFAAFSTPKPNEIYQGKKIVITSAIKNNGTAAYSGLLDVSLYNLDGEHAFTIEQKQVNQLCKSCNTSAITFTNENLNIEPGTYLLAMQHHTDADGWQLTGSAKFANPVKVVVQVAPISGDQYEDNNTVAKAYTLPLNFNGTTARVTTNGTNIHVGTDYDYFKLNLPAGKKYEISVRVHDSYAATDNNTYTNDVLFSLSEDGQEWTEAFDDEMEEPLEVEGGKTLYANVAPYFQGETGTYLLDITVKEMITTGIEDDLEDLAVQAYPNPTTGILHLQQKKDFQQYSLVSLTGQVLLEVPKNTSRLDISHLPTGIYMLRIQTEEGYQVQKILKK